MTDILTQFVVKSEKQGPRYPWLQIDNYKPSKDEVPGIVVPEGSLALLSPEGAEMLSDSKPVEVSYGGGESSLAYAIPDDVRWVILCEPNTWHVAEKATGKVRRIFKGLKFGDTYISVAKVFLACERGGKLMLDADGQAQIWGLKLSSLRTEWIKTNREGQIDGKTIVDLNKALCEKHDVKGWLTQLVSVPLCAYSRVRKSTQKQGASSIGVMFGFTPKGSPKALSADDQAKVFALVTSDDFKSLAKDPFNLEAKKDVETDDNYGSEEAF